MKIDFKELLGTHQDEIIFIIHNMPDPDAMSSALGMRSLISFLGYKVGKIYYTGEISHPQNRSMLTLLNIDSMVNYDTAIFEEKHKAVLLDTNNIGPGTNQADIPPSTVDLVAVIDHHKGSNPKGVSVDTRPVGACASIVWEYLSDSEFDFDTEEGKTVATALIVGIVTDTDSLMSDNISDLDFRAYQDLLNHVDRQKMNGIMRYPLPSYLFELRQRAFQEENKTLEDSSIVSGLGVITQTKRDALPIIADEFLRMTGVTTAVVFAIIKDEVLEYIDICVRSKNQTVDVGEFLQKSFGTGGGKRGAGRAKINLDFFSTNGDDALGNEIWSLVYKIVKKKIFDNMKGS